jgi:hypothetical protein
MVYGLEIKKKICFFLKLDNKKRVLYLNSNKKKKTLKRKRKK